MLDISKTNSNIAKLQLPKKKGLIIEPGTKTLLSSKREDYIMSVNYVSLLRSLTSI